MNHVPIRMAAALLLAAAGALIALTLMRSERLRIMWNTPLYLFDGRHKLHGGPAAAILDTPAELWIRSGASGQFVESAVTGAPAAAAWDARYFRRVAVPSSRSAPGQQGDLACDGSNLYLYHSASTGWLRVQVEAEW